MSETLTLTKEELGAHIAKAVAEAMANAKTASKPGRKPGAAPKPDPYAMFLAHPDLYHAIKATGLRVGSLPSLCVLAVWNGAAKASEIAAKHVLVTPKGGKGGNIPATPTLITSALRKAELAFLAANVGVGIDVKPIHISGGDSTVRKIAFEPRRVKVEVTAPAETAPHAMAAE